MELGEVNRYLLLVIGYRKKDWFFLDDGGKNGRYLLENFGKRRVG